MGRRLGVGLFFDYICAMIVGFSRYFAVLASVLCCFIASAQGSENGRGASGSAAGDYITVYQKYLSHLKNTHCRMYPSCSAYAKLAFSHNSFAEAMAMTADRLTRCGHDTQLYPNAVIGGRLYAVDFPKGVEVPAGLGQSGKISVAAETVAPKSAADSSIVFINRLINKGNYWGAMTEIDRLLYYFPNDFSLNPQIGLSHLKCYEGLGKYSAGLGLYYSFPSVLRSDYRISLAASHLLELTSDWDGAIDLYKECAGAFDGSLHNVSPYGRLSVLYLRKGDYEQSLQMIEKRAAVEENYPSLVQSQRVVCEARDASRKSSALAQALSIIPGAGYLYAGAPSNALTSLLVNCLLGYATYTSFNSGNTGVGVILGALTLSFYVGNSFGAASCASRYNERILERSVNQLEKLNPYIN